MIGPPPPPLIELGFQQVHDSLDPEVSGAAAWSVGPTVQGASSQVQLRPFHVTLSQCLKPPVPQFPLGYDGNYSAHLLGLHRDGGEANPQRPVPERHLV